MHAATFKVVNSAQGSSCKLKLVHALSENAKSRGAIGAPQR